MKKTPSVFLRNPKNMHELTSTPNPEALWVFGGEGKATRKYDGTCVMLDENGDWWARREVKKNKPEPPNWLELDADPITGKRMGWEPIGQSGYRGAWSEAVAVHPDIPGTYELCGPKINGNPEGFTLHKLIRHAIAAELHNVGDVVHDLNDPQLFNKFKSLMLDLVGEHLGYEGLVWHHPDGRMAKLKVSDFKK